jgi:tetratricopeptide (TPR) repeat protein
LGNIDTALVDMNKAIYLDGKYAGDFVNRSSIYLEKKEYQLVINDATRALQLREENNVVYYNRGVALAELGHKDEACEDLKKAMEKGHPLAATAFKKYCPKEKK